MWLARHHYPFVVGLGNIGFFLLYLFASRSIPNDADNASIVLEGQAMLHQQLLLNGWALPPDSFITSEIPLYALLDWLVPALPPLLKVVPALIYALTVVGATLMAAMIADRSTRWLAAAACLAILAFPTGIMAILVFQGPQHIGTILLSLLAFVSYDRFVRHRRPWVALMAFCLATIWGIIGDPLAEILVPIPVILVSVLAQFKARGRDVRAWWLLGAAIVAFGLGYVLRNVLIFSGTNIGNADLKFINIQGFIHNLQLLIFGIGALFHLDPEHVSPSIPSTLWLMLNSVVMVIFMAGLVFLLARLILAKQDPQRLELVLGCAILCNLGVFLISTYPVDPFATRYLLPAFVYGGILAAPAIAALLSVRWMRRVVMVALVCNVLAFGTQVINEVPAPVPEAPVIAVLQAHHLTDGLGTFWASATITVQSDDHVRVRQVISNNGKIYGYVWHADSAWYRQSSLRATNFLVYTARDDRQALYQAAVTSFGVPNHIYLVEDYTILAWERPIIDGSYQL